VTDIQDEANRIMTEAGERLEAAGIPDDEVPHVFTDCGLALLDAALCPQCLVETLEEVREEIDAKISEARGRSKGRHAH
jgi:hypothetical protein